jgi:hypothetical protein
MVIKQPWIGCLVSVPRPQGSDRNFFWPHPSHRSLAFAALTKPLAVLSIPLGDLAPKTPVDVALSFH